MGWKKPDIKKWNIKELGLSKLGLLLLLGVGLLFLSGIDFGGGKKDTGDAVSGTQNISAGLQEGGMGDTADETERYIARQEERLKNMLEKVAGIGSVEVMITVKASKELVTLADRPSTQKSVEETDSDGGSRVTKELDKKESTVMETQDGDQRPYVTKEIEPQIAGVLVLASGAGNGQVENEIVEAVIALFDVPAHKIKVMKRE